MAAFTLQSFRSLHTTPSVRARVSSKKKRENEEEPMTAAERVRAAQKRAQAKIEQDQKDNQNNVTRGGIATGTAFGGDLKLNEYQRHGIKIEDSFKDRNPGNMELALNPRPEARLRWQQKMMIREVKRRGRLSKRIQLARTEREHTSRSHFFKTSMKKLAPLARQIAGKSIDEAILQMRFSNKKVSKDMREHLIMARNEAIVMKGMGLGRVAGDGEKTELQGDPSRMPALPHQTPLKALKKTEEIDLTDIYIAQAWTNRGPYNRVPEFRARGRMNILRPPHTGISVMLKEEKTRVREKAEKEMRALKKRTGKSMWVHLPDRPITTQRQHVLW
jgi:ribosomal protein L22